MVRKVARQLRALILLVFATAAAGATPPPRTFIFMNSIRDLNEFRAFAKIASRLKRYGSVQIDIGVLASKAAFEMPPVWSPWHEYAVYNANISKFFPTPTLLLTIRRTGWRRTVNCSWPNRPSCRSWAWRQLFPVMTPTTSPKLSSSDTRSCVDPAWITRGEARARSSRIVWIARKPAT